MTHKNEITTETEDTTGVRRIPQNSQQVILPVDDEHYNHPGSNTCVFNPVNNFSPTIINKVDGPDVANHVPVSDNRKSNPDMTEVGSMISGIAGIIGSLLSK